MVGPPFDRSAGSRIEGGEDQAVLDDDVMDGKGECFMLLIRCFWVMIESKRSLMSKVEDQLAQSTLRMAMELRTYAP